MKKFEAPSSEPGEPDANLARELGIELDEPAPGSGLEEEGIEDLPDEKPRNKAQEKANTEGKKVVDTYSAEIQRHSEELYGTVLSRVRNEEGYIYDLLESESPVDQKMLKKILERNPGEFGASTPEELRKVVEIELAGDDPVQKKLVEQSHEIEELKNRQSASDWVTWKKSRQVEEGSRFDKELDSVHSDHPSLPFVDVVALAKGRLGTSPAHTKEGTAGGGGTPPSTEELATASPLAKALLPSWKDPKKAKEALQFARNYNR